MQVINKRIIVIFICLSIFIFGLFKLFNKKEIELDNVILDVQKQDNTFAIYLEESEAHYEEKDLIPTDGYIFNEEKSQCISIDGNIIKNILSYDYDNKKLIVDTTESINCYLYFDKGAGLEIIGKGPKELNLDVKNGDANWTGMYRFQGQQSEEIENYICFGTSDSNICTSNPDKYMYRIIGIEENGRIKVIKKEALEETEQWWTDKNTNVNWPNSKIFTNINGEKFLKNTELVPEGWEDKIDNNKWLFGSMDHIHKVNGSRQTGVEVYKIESGQKEGIWSEKASEGEQYKGIQAEKIEVTGGEQKGQTVWRIIHTEKWNETNKPHEVDAKIGLMYISDYDLAVSNEANCQIDNRTYEGVCDNGWVNIVFNETLSSIKSEWLMTSKNFDPYNAEHQAFCTNFNSLIGSFNIIALNTQLLVRPVFYLKSNLKLKEGSGTITTPYLLDI